MVWSTQGNARHHENRKSVGNKPSKFIYNELQKNKKKCKLQTNLKPSLLLPIPEYSERNTGATQPLSFHTPPTLASLPPSLNACPD